MAGPLDITVMCNHLTLGVDLSEGQGVTWSIPDRGPGGSLL